MIQSRDIITCEHVTSVAYPNIFSGESAQLANDFNTLCEKFFPCRELAKAAVINDSHRYHIPQEQHLQRVMSTK